MIHLDDTHVIQTKNHSSKGNQLKWFEDNTWYKADYLGYESLSEYVVSKLLKQSSIANFVIDYSIEKVKYKSKEYRCCSSRNFLGY